MRSRHFTPRKTESRHHDYDYSTCYECGNRYYDPIIPWDGEVDPDFEPSNIIDFLFALTPADTPLLSMAAGKAEDREFTWETDND